jgi:hypothetical protein
MKHKVRRYSVIKMIDGKRVVLSAFSCGPCATYAKYYRTLKDRERTIERQHA